jgi:hypothetical protein
VGLKEVVIVLRSRLQYFVVAACLSFGWVARCWHDQTAAEWHLFSASVVREQSRADHFAAVLFAVARVVISVTVAELIFEESKRK